MELALVLVFAVIVETFLTAFLLGRLRDYRRRVAVCEKRLDVFETAGAAPAAGDAVEVAPVAAAVPANVSELLAKVTPEDVKQAEAILKAMGIEA